MRGLRVRVNKMSQIGNCLFKSFAALYSAQSSSVSTNQVKQLEHFSDALDPAAKSGKSAVFDIILSPDSPRRYLSERKSYNKGNLAEYNDPSVVKTTFEAHLWMRLVATALESDQYFILDNFLNHGKLDTSTPKLFRLLSRAIMGASPGCVKGLMSIIASRDDWFFKDIT